MKKKCKAVMLPTEKGILILEDKFEKGMILDTCLNHNFKEYNPENNYEHVGVHSLYIISDDEIKEGDNVYSKHYGLGVVIEDNHPNYKGEFPIRVKYPNIIVPYFNDGGYSSDRKLIYLQDCKKVIASTDPELVFNNKVINANYGVKMEGFHHKQLPQIPESFIKSYVEAGGIDEVMVEYELIHMLKNRRGGQTGMYQLKLTNNNEVVISMVEEKVYDEKWLSELYAEKMYSREEVAAKIRQYFNNDEGIVDEEDCEKWIEENL